MKKEFGDIIEKLKELEFVEEIAKNEDVLPAWRGDEWFMQRVINHDWLGKLMLEIRWYVHGDGNVIPLKEIFNPYNSDRDGGFWFTVSKLYDSGEVSENSLVNNKLDMELLKRILTDNKVTI